MRHRHRGAFIAIRLAHAFAAAVAHETLSGLHRFIRAAMFFGSDFAILADMVRCGRAHTVAVREMMLSAAAMLLCDVRHCFVKMPVRPGLLAVRVLNRMSAVTVVMDCRVLAVSVRVSPVSARSIFRKSTICFALFRGRALRVIGVTRLLMIQSKRSV